MKISEKTVELRSGKVRQILGEIPPPLIRTGISILFIVFISLLFCCYYLKFTYFIKTTANLKVEKNMLICNVQIPIKYSTLIRPGQKVIVHFDMIPTEFGNKLKCQINSISSNIEIHKGQAFMSISIIIPNPFEITNKFKISVNSELKTIIEVETAKISLLDRLL